MSITESSSKYDNLEKMFFGCDDDYFDVLRFLYDYNYRVTCLDYFRK